MTGKIREMAGVAGQTYIGITRARADERCLTGSPAASAIDEFPSILENSMVDRCTRDVDTSRPAGRLPRILALDLATTTGWALRTADGQITTVSFRSGRFEDGGMRYLRLTKWLTEIDRLSGPIGVIHFEEAHRHAGTDAAHVYGGLLATITAWTELRNAPYQGVPVGTIKRHATAKGNADKAAMMAAVRARIFAPAHDSEADAIALLLWAIATNGGLA